LKQQIIRYAKITPFQQTVIVDDQTAPVFAAIPDFLGECEPGMEAKISQWLSDVTATDNCKVKSITHDFNIANLPADCCGDLIVNFVAVDECGNIATTTGTIRLKAKVSVDIDPINALACAGSPITFTAEPHNGGSNPKFQWYRNGTAVAGATGITYTVLNPQEGDKVYVRLTSDIVCTDVKEASSPVSTVTITNILTPAVSVAPLNPDICDGETVTFTATPVNGGTNPAYQWLVNGQPVTGATGSTFTYAPKDQDQITVRMTSDLVCVVTPTATSSPAIANVIPNLVVTVDLSANRDTVCEGEPITLQAAYKNGGEDPVFTWYVNTIPVLGNNFDTYTYIPEKGDKVYVSLTSSELCVVDSTVNSDIHTIDVLVIDPVTIVSPPDRTFDCLGDEPPITDIQVMIDRGYIANFHHVDRNSLSHTDEILSKTLQGTVIQRTYTVLDLCGGEYSDTQLITVSDIEPPKAVKKDYTAYLDETGAYTVKRDDILASASDNCTPFDKLVIRAVPPTVNCNDVGKVIRVEITVIDEAGNESVSVYANITVLDQMPPEALCRDITVYLDENGRASITPADIDNGSTDNCQIVSRTLDRTSFDCNSVGPNPVKLTVVDASGNIDVCDAIVTVKDTIAPVAICQSVDIQIGPNGQVRLSPTMVDGGSFDNCGVPSLRIEPEFLTCENVGENIVTLYVTDRYGNVSTCQTIVNVLGNTPPIARDDNVKALMNQNTMILILMNDTDAEGDLDPSTVWIMSPPEHGQLSVNPSGTVTYKPFDNYLGPDTFTYRVCDNGLPCSEECDTAVVYITVVEDNLAPIARDDEFEGGCLAISGNILLNDSDPDFDNIFLSPYLILPPANGEIELNANGSFLYVSKAGFVGLDSLIYQICDDGYPSKCDTATVTFNIFKDEDCDGEPDEGPLTFFIPEGFSPNGDGVHDFFQILGIEDYPDAKLYIFNRWGSKLFEKEHYGNLTYWGSPEEAWWWGYSEASLTLGGGKVPVGNYIYILELGNGTTHTGTVMVSY
jgi:gliding motility-associated-like protein